MARKSYTFETDYGKFRLSPTKLTQLWFSYNQDKWVTFRSVDRESILAVFNGASTCEGWTAAFQRKRNRLRFGCKVFDAKLLVTWAIKGRIPSGTRA